MAPKKRRVSGKQPPPAQYVLPSPAMAALVDEAWSEIVALSDDSRRKHIHWVHVRTADPALRRPESFTREQFWQHLRRVYKDVYPRPQNATGSILLFGCVAKERHAASTQAGEREEHHHSPCYTSEQHRWLPVAKRSLDLGVKLHAACHDGYSIMYVYVKCPSPKKQLAELDQDLWHSEDHPRGQTLQDLLNVGLQAVRRFHKRGGNCVGSGEGRRFKAGEMYALVKETGVRTVPDLQMRAHAAAGQGDSRLAEFCTVNTEDDLQKYLDGAWAVIEAPTRGLRSDSERVQKLHRATSSACTCGGVWVGYVVFVLQNNGEDVKAFCSDVIEALTKGACRGVNMAIIGPPGCGKSTVFDALDLIFEVAGKPERDSSFPFANLMDAEVLLWQEFTWHPKMCAFEDLLSLLCGERFGVRVPCKKPHQFKNTSPMFYTAWAPLRYTSSDYDQMQVYNEAVGERFKTRHWTRSLPKVGRVAPFPHCAHCFASFILGNA